MFFRIIGNLPIILVFWDYWKMTNNIGFLRLLVNGPILLVFWGNWLNSNNIAIYWISGQIALILAILLVRPELLVFSNIIGIIGISNNLAIILV